MVSEMKRKLEEIERLSRAHAKPLLALKMYDKLIADMLSGGRTADCNILFFDYILHCNAFALQEITRKEVCVEASRDYFRLAFSQFEQVKGVTLDRETLESYSDSKYAMTSECASMGEADDSPCTTPAHPRLLTTAHPLDNSTLTLLALTLSNWACIEFTSGDAHKAFCLLDLSYHPITQDTTGSCSSAHKMDSQNWVDQLHQESHFRTDETAEQMETESLHLGGGVGTIMSCDMSWLGYTGSAVKVINQSVCQLMHCNFPEAEQMLTSLVSSLQQRQSAEHLNPAMESESGGVTALYGLASFALGCALEYSSCEAAVSAYQEAAILFESGTGSREVMARAASIATDTHKKLVEEIEAARERAAAEQATESARREAAKKLSLSVAKKGGGKRNTASGANAGTRKRFSVQPERRAIVWPPIGSALRSYIRHEGLPMFPATVLGLSDARGYLCGNSRYFSSPLAGAENQHEKNVLAVLMCKETPLQWSLNVERAGREPPPRHSVWASRKPPLPYLVPHRWRWDSGGLDGASGGGVHDSGDKKLRPALKLFMPKPLPKSAIENAQKEVGAVTKLLGQRLNLLLKSEKAFEDRWQATERVKGALMSYYVPQELLKWKARVIDQERMKAFREDYSARVLTRFFRLVMKEKPLQYGFVSRQQRREMAENKAAVVLQKHARRWNARQERKRLEEERQGTVGDIIRLQSLFRRRKAVECCRLLRCERASHDAERAQAAKRDFAATQIQRVYRGHATRLALLCAAGRLHEATLHHLRNSRHYYATVIQSRVRGVAIRRQYGRAVHARRCLGRNAYRTAVLQRACVVVQCCYRRHMARRRYAGLIQERCRVAAAEEASALMNIAASLSTAKEKREFDAAARIQSMYHGIQAKQSAAELKSARNESASLRKGEVYEPFNMNERVF